MAQSDARVIVTGAGFGLIPVTAQPTYDAMGDGPYWPVLMDDTSTLRVHDDDAEVINHAD